MKQIVLIFIIFTLSFTQSATAVEADIVNNPAQPVTDPNAKKVDRTVKVTEVFRITDIGEDFFLKRPSRIRVAPDGSVFVMDHSQACIMKFNDRGKFVTRILKKGVGPGELANLYSYWLGKNEVIACSLLPVKVIGMDHQGKLIREFRVKTNDYFFTLMGRFSGKYYFYRAPFEGGDGFKISQVPLVFTDEKGVITKTGLTLPVKKVRFSITERFGTKENSQVVTKIQSAHVTRYTYAITAGRYLYLTTDERYLIHQYDLEKDSVVKKFRRKYTPVSYTPNPNDKFVNSPKFKASYKWEHYTDVQRLMADGDRVWAFTSTVDKTRGIQVDVFNAGGKYIDRFYLQVPNLEYPDDKLMERLYYYNGFLYTIEMDEEDNPNVVKYKLGPGGAPS